MVADLLIGLSLVSCKDQIFPNCKQSHADETIHDTIYLQKGQFLKEVEFQCNGRLWYITEPMQRYYKPKDKTIRSAKGDKTTTFVESN